MKLINAHVFRRIFGIYAEELWAMSENELLHWTKCETDIDHVSIVQCKDCASSYVFEDWETGEKTRYCQKMRGCWNRDDLLVDDNNFCCWGKRKRRFTICVGREDGMSDDDD